MWHPVWPRGAGPREAFALRRLTRVSRGFDAAEAGLRLPAAFPLPPGASQGAAYPSRLCPARPWKLPDFGELVLSATGPGVWPRPFGERLQRRRARPAVHGPVPSAGAPTARLGTGGAGGAHWVPYRAGADMAAKDRKEHAPRVSPLCSLVPNGGGSGRGPKGPQSCGGGPYRMGGSRGPPTGELRRGAPGKGGGPFAAAFTCRAETGTF